MAKSITKQAGTQGARAGVAVAVRTGDAAGLDAHVATLNSAAAMVTNVNTMLERVEAQMRAAGMGRTVTGQLGTARDSGTAYAQALRSARQLLEAVNRQVQEAYVASRGQAADKGYQMGGR
jgi:flagellar biosynthesis/type III secretory pathway protein FliH